MSHRAFLVIVSLCAVSTSATGATFSGHVRARSGEPFAGAFVTARDSLRGFAVSVTTSVDGTYIIGPIKDGSYELRAHLPGFEAAAVSTTVQGNRDDIDFLLDPIDDVLPHAPGFAFLNALPPGKEKRRLILDCMGCHPINQRIVFDQDGELLDETAFKVSLQKMLSFAGATTMFPIMSPDLDVQSTAKFLATHLTEKRLRAEAEDARRMRAPPGGYSITEYDLPEQKDFPHDLMLDGHGKVLITGMFTNLMYLLDPATAEFTTKQIPAPGGNPRAIEVDNNGDWWILGGMPKQASRYRLAEDEWEHFDIGMYPHSTMIDEKNRVWFNGHFTNNPIEMGYVDGKTGDVVTLEVPPNDMPAEEGGPIPYGLRVGPGETVWITELAGNRLVKYGAATGEFKTYTLPSPYSGPRRLDIANDGSVWIPEFASGKLARFDPETENFREYDFPTPNSLPYCARIDHRRGWVWVSQCANDAIARFDMETETVTEYRLPTRIAFIRHMDIDQETGDVWAAYSHSPGLHPRIARLRVE